MLNRFWALTLGALLLFSAPAIAAECQEGASQQEIITFLQEKGIRSITYTGEKKDKLWAVITELLGNVPADFVVDAILVALPDGHQANVGIIRDGCAIGVIPMPEELFVKIKDKALGQGV